MGLWIVSVATTSEVCVTSVKAVVDVVVVSDVVVVTAANMSRISFDFGFRKEKSWVQHPAPSTIRFSSNSKQGVNPVLLAPMKRTCNSKHLLVFAGVTERQEHADESSEAANELRPDGITGLARLARGVPSMYNVEVVVVTVAIVEVSVEAVRVAVEMKTVLVEPMMVDVGM